jgi:hypothetical protein
MRLKTVVPCTWASMPGQVIYPTQVDRWTVACSGLHTSGKNPTGLNPTWLRRRVMMIWREFEIWAQFRKKSILAILSYAPGELHTRKRFMFDKIRSRPVKCFFFSWSLAACISDGSCEKDNAFSNELRGRTTRKGLLSVHDCGASILLYIWRSSLSRNLILV